MKNEFLIFDILFAIFIGLYAFELVMRYIA